MKVMMITPAELEQTWIHREAQLIDLRPAEEFRKDHIPGAWNVSEDQIEHVIQRQGRYRFYILYCQRGITSLQLARKLVEKGYQIGTLAGGINNYKRWKSRQ